MRLKLDLHLIVGGRGSTKDRTGVIEHGLTMLRAKRAEVNQDKTANLGLGSRLSNWRDVVVNDLSGEFRAIIQSRTFRKQHVAPRMLSA
jgi:phage terminase large subunit-like protein